MRDNKHIISVCDKKFEVHGTFSNDPAIYISKDGYFFLHISDRDRRVEYHTFLENILEGLREENDVVIFAHMSNTGNIIKIDDIEYNVDLDGGDRPQVYFSSGCSRKSFYHIDQYGEYSRNVFVPEILLDHVSSEESRIGQVVIIANLLVETRNN